MASQNHRNRHPYPTTEAMEIFNFCGAGAGYRGGCGGAAIFGPGGPLRTDGENPETQSFRIRSLYHRGGGPNRVFPVLGYSGGGGLGVVGGVDPIT